MADSDLRCKGEDTLFQNGFVVPDAKPMDRVIECVCQVQPAAEMLSASISSNLIDQSHPAFR